MSTAAIVAALLIAALAPAAIAQRKRQGFATYYVFGLLLLPVAIVVALLVRDRRRRCATCDEVVRPAASVCLHCGRELVEQTPATSSA